METKEKTRKVYAYDVFSLDGSYLTTIATHKPDNQAIANAIAELYNPLLVTWKPACYNDRAWWQRLSMMDSTKRKAFIARTHRFGVISDYQLWEVLSSFHSPISSGDAIKVYKTLGFKPFAGYPLER